MKNLSKITSYSALILTLIILIYGLINVNKSITFPIASETMLFFVITFFIPILNFKKELFKMDGFQIKWMDAKYIILSVIATFYLFKTLPHIFFDDSGFTLRYLDNFSEGFYYTFNKNEAPVYGISSFLYLNFCFLLKFITGLNSNNTLILANLTGVYFILFFLYKILREFTKDERVMFITWLAVILSSRHLINVLFSGMETSVHLAVILIAIYYTISNKFIPSFLFIALIIISKLDAISVAAVLFASLIIVNRKSLKNRKNRLRFIKYFSLFTAIPLILFILFTFIVFGSPFPQSAMAKIYYYPHPQSSFFPFLENLTNNFYLSVSLIIFIILSVFTMLSIILSKEYFKSYMWLIPSGIFILMMMMYFFYNPSERMLWYYALPVFFMFFQIYLSAIYFIKLIFNKTSFWLVLTTVFLMFLFIRIDVNASVKWMKKNLNISENERILIGKYLGSISSSKSILLSKHGHISRYFKGYVLDNSGLNSKITTRFKLNADSLINKYSPDFIIHHAYADFIKTANKNNYSLSKVFYDISLNNSPVWVLFRKNDKNTKSFTTPINPDMIEGITKKFDLSNIYRIRGDKITIKVQADSTKKCDVLIYGAVRFQNPYFVNYKIVTSKQTISSRIKVRKIGAEGEISRFVQEIFIPIPSFTLHSNFQVILTTDHTNIPVSVISPFLVYNHP